MFIERFFNPVINANTNCILYDFESAYNHCKINYSFIRHYSFKSFNYIKFDGKNFIWNDGNKVDLRKMPRKGNGYGRYFSELYNLESF